MPLPPGWSASAAIDEAHRTGRCDDISWSGHAWRIHSSRFPADSYGGSLHNTGRFHRGRDLSQTLLLRLRLLQALRILGYNRSGAG